MNYQKLAESMAEESGVTALLMAFFLMIFVGLLTLVIDLGRLYVVRNELQNAADAAALAGAKELYQATETIDINQVVTAAQDCAQQNKSLGLTQLHASVEIGKWDFKTQIFTPVASPMFTTEVNAVRTTVKRLGENGQAADNPMLFSAFAHFLGFNQLGTQATAVAYLGIVGSTSLDIPLALPDSTITQALHTDSPDSFLNILTPTPAYAAVTKTVVFKDLGGIPNLYSPTLDLSRGAWVDAVSPPSFNNIEPYIKATKKFPAKKVGDIIYPMSEAYYPSYHKKLFSALQERYNEKKNAQGKWRVTIAIYDKNKPTASVKPPQTWNLFGLTIPQLVPEAQACTALKSPVIYIDGFAMVDIIGVTYKSDCSYYSYPDDRSCPKANSMTIEIPLDQNLQIRDAVAGGNNYERTYNAMNPQAKKVAVFNAAPKIVK
ncbi:MAG: pilus assembly protein TadG-related protein [Desulfobacca sp.]|uniref:pilus assembly protein TadG-related protein n=1 Tax=Desulfobacca sp. TaxID=2067990 RepID=UPI00404A12CE